MARFQLTGNRLIEPCMDLLPDLEITSPEALAHVAQSRQAHEEQQQTLAGIVQLLNVQILTSTYLGQMKWP